MCDVMSHLRVKGYKTDALQPMQPYNQLLQLIYCIEKLIWGEVTLRFENYLACRRSVDKRGARHHNAPQLEYDRCTEPRRRIVSAAVVLIALQPIERVSRRGAAAHPRMALARCTRSAAVVSAALKPCGCTSKSASGTARPNMKKSSPWCDRNRSRSARPRCRSTLASTIFDAAITIS